MHTQGSDGDVLPFLRIAAELHARGHEVALCTHSPYRRLVAGTGVEFVPVDDEEGYERLRSQTPQLMRLRRPADIAAFYEKVGLTGRLRAEVAGILERSVPGSTVLIGRHTSSDAIRIAGEVTGDPVLWVALSPTQLLAEPVAAAHHELGLAPGIERVRQSFGLSPVTNWQRWLGDPDSYLCLWAPWFESAGPASARGCPPLGFLLPDGPDDVTARGATAEPPPEVSALLDSGEPVVLVTGGTGTMVHERLYPAAVGGVAALGARALVVCAFPDLLPGPLPAGSVRVPRADFAALLPRVSAIVHHGGMGTFARALVTGTPQLLLAHAADRRDNAGRLSRSGLASWLPLPQWSPDRVCAALAELPSSASVRARLSSLSPGGAVDTGLEGVVRAVEARLAGVRTTMAGRGPA